MKLEGGKWKKISWDDAINEIGDKMLEIRKTSGPIQCIGLVLQSLTTNSHICSASFMLLGLQQWRPPGADLSLDHGCRCSKHLGLWCDDKQLQRHAQLKGNVPYRV